MLDVCKNVLFCAGMVALTLGLCLMWLPFGIAFAGLLCLAAGLVIDRRQEKKGEKTHEQDTLGTSA